MNGDEYIRYKIIQMGNIFEGIDLKHDPGRTEKVEHGNPRGSRNGQWED